MSKRPSIDSADLMPTYLTNEAEHSEAHHGTVEHLEFAQQDKAYKTVIQAVCQWLTNHKNDLNEPASQVSKLNAAIVQYKGAKKSRRDETIYPPSAKIIFKLPETRTCPASGSIPLSTSQLAGILAAAELEDFHLTTHDQKRDGRRNCDSITELPAGTYAFEQKYFILDIHSRDGYLKIGTAYFSTDGMLYTAPDGKPHSFPAIDRVELLADRHLRTESLSSEQRGRYPITNSHTATKLVCADGFRLSGMFDEKDPNLDSSAFLACFDGQFDAEFPHRLKVMGLRTSHIMRYASIPEGGAPARRSSRYNMITLIRELFTILAQTLPTDYCDVDDARYADPRKTLAKLIIMNRLFSLPPTEESAEDQQALFQQRVANSLPVIQEAIQKIERAYALQRPETAPQFHQAAAIILRRIDLSFDARLTELCQNSFRPLVSTVSSLVTPALSTATQASTLTR